MHSRLSELLALADRQRATLLDIVRAIPADRLTQRPVPESWSAIEVLDHLQRVEGTVARLLATRIADAKEKGLAPESSAESVLGSLDRYRVADRSRRIEAPDRLRPRDDLTLDEALEGLARSREALRAAAAAGDGYALGEISHPHPIFGPIDGYQWILFVAHHEQRHTAQVQEIAAAMESA